MFRALFFLFAMWLLPGVAPAGDFYRWVDANGGVHYSDLQPPHDAKSAHKFQASGNVVEVDKESFETRYAKVNQPVVLYLTNCGPVCDQARDFLRQRGVPYTAKDPSKEPEIAVELKKLVGKIEVPVIRVGKQHQLGFDASSWDSLLDAAGYPKTPLPSAEKTKPEPPRGGTQ